MNDDDDDDIFICMFTAWRCDMAWHSVSNSKLKRSFFSLRLCIQHLKLTLLRSRSQSKLLILYLPTINECESINRKKIEEKKTLAQTTNSIQFTTKRFEFSLLPFLFRHFLFTFYFSRPPISLHFFASHDWYLCDFIEVINRVLLEVT